ncbi:MAG TPA: nicotinamide riboside transporter PnuC [Chitinophagaceae bacterium]|nr:MAG: nicotinamide mononucleotide transporter PnuC [Bacteroidetes bacterium OLB11]HMN33644.1 nicotinamide riboside transporter PnuC [Chitinophagaceae bacterium]
MLLVNFIQHIEQQFIQTDLLEWVAFVFAVLQVSLAAKNNVINFYAGIISTAFYTFLFFQIGLFAESVLNLYYFIVSVTGVLLWTKKNDKEQLPISTLRKKEWLKILLFNILVFFFLYWVLSTFTTSTVPFADAFVSSIAWAGTFLMIFRKIENWIFLTISNVFSFPLFLYKGVELTALLYILYIIIGIIGFLKWKKALTTFSENDK